MFCLQEREREGRKLWKTRISRGSNASGRPPEVLSGRGDFDLGESAVYLSPGLLVNVAHIEAQVRPCSFVRKAQTGSVERQENMKVRAC